MKNLTIREARQSLSHLDRLLETEGESTITRRGKPVAHVVPVGPRSGKCPPASRCVRACPG